MPGHMPGQPTMAPPGMQPARPRLDPNLMPSAVQVMEEDRRTRVGDFHTGYPQAEQPPLVTATETTEIDTGNCMSRFMRATMYCAPNTQDLLKSTELPFSVHVTPLADPEVGVWASCNEKLALL